MNLHPQNKVANVMFVKTNTSQNSQALLLNFTMNLIDKFPTSSVH
jgi:hypothetical protein